MLFRRRLWIIINCILISGRWEFSKIFNRLWGFERNWNSILKLFTWINKKTIFSSIERIEIFSSNGLFEGWKEFCLKADASYSFNHSQFAFRKKSNLLSLFSSSQFIPVDWAGCNQPWACNNDAIYIWDGALGSFSKRMVSYTGCSTVRAVQALVGRAAEVPGQLHNRLIFPSCHAICVGFWGVKFIELHFSHTWTRGGLIGDRGEGK